MEDWSRHVEFAVILITLIGGIFTLDAKIERQGERTDKLGERTDNLYKMFLDAQKDYHEKFYDLLKEKK